MDDLKDHEGPAEAEHAACEQCGAGVDSAPFTWSGLAAWLADSLILGALVAWLAHTVQTSLGFAPLLFFPAIAGGLLGLLLAGARLFTPIGHQRTVLCGILLAVVVASAGQHVLGYQAAAAQREEDQQKTEMAEAAFPDLDKERLRAARFTFWKFLQGQAVTGRPVGDWFTLRGPAVWVSWAVDAVILGAAAFYSSAVLFRCFWRRPITAENTSA